MKIIALRVADAGPFVDGVAMEGLSGRLDVLAAPNEAGKSTLFRALRAVFSEAHTSSSTKFDLGQLKPRRGGNPLIECDFEADGRNWRLRKRFGRGKLAELSDLASSRIVARGPEAEAEITRLLTLRAERTGLLWVEQGASFDLPGMSGGTAAMISHLIESEVTAAAGGGELRAIKERAEAELARLVTLAGSKPKTGGPFALALRECERLEREHALAAQAAGSLEQRLQSLSRLVDERARLADPQAWTTLRQSLEKLRADHDVARQRETRRKEAEARRKHAEIEAETARIALQQFDAKLKEAVDLAALRAELAKVAAGLTENLAAGEQRGRVAQQALDRLLATERDLRRRLADAHAAQQRAGWQIRHTELSERLTAANAVIDEGKAVRTALQSNPVTDPVLAQIHALQRQIDEHAASLAAAAPVIDIAYARGGEGRIRIGAQPLAADIRLVAVEPVTLDIEGVGRIVIAAGGGQQRRDVVRQHAEAVQRLNQELTQLGCASVEDARQAADLRRTLTADRERLAGRLKDLVPHGVDALRTELAALDVKIGAPQPQTETIEPSSLAAELASISTGVAAEQATQAAVAREVAAIHNDLARSEARLRAATERAAALATDLPPSSAWDGERARLAADRERLDAAARAVIREAEALTESGSAQRPVAELAADIARQDLELETLQARLHQLEMAIAKLQGELATAANDGIAERAGELAGELLRARAAADRWTLEADALGLLCRTLGEVEHEFHAKAVTPVVARMNPYLEQLFPGSRLTLGDGFVVDGLKRAGAAGMIGDLSRGTREQIAIIARLGLARLLADRGLSVPLILDDALVFSDDVRRRRMFAMLAAAAGTHQVVVFTCHETASAPLVREHGGQPLAMSSWAATGAG
jgi:energy-coupling factor transporter ATP-binding protein EcfA2